MTGLIYPPEDPGIPFGTVEGAMQSQQELVRRLRIHVGRDPKVFEQRYLLPLQRVASLVATLPASSDGLFSGPGGLFRACVENAFGSFQASDGRIFVVHAGVEERHLLEGRWRYVCFLAALLWPLGRTLEAVRITSRNGDSWSPRIEPIMDWGQRLQIRTFYCSWPADQVTPGPSSTAAALALQVAGTENIRWLEEGSMVLTTALMNMTSGAREDRYGTAFDLVSSMWQRLCDKEQLRRPQSYGRLEFGRHLAPHLVDAMAALLQSGRWREGVSPLWADAKGVYLRWPQAAEQIIGSARDQGVQGLPSTPSGLLTALEDNELIEVHAESGALMEMADEEGVLCAGVKLTRPRTLLPDYESSHYAGKRMICTSDIARSDPLVSSRQRVAKSSIPDQDEDEVLVPPAPGPDLLSSSLISDEKDEHGDEGNDPSDSENMHQLSADSVPEQKPEKEPEHAQEISYHELLPDSWKRQIRRREGEVLGKLVSIWKECAPTSDLVPIDEGCAIAKSVLDEQCSNPVDFLANVAQTGLLYVNPTTPGRLLHEMELPKGTKKRHFFVIAAFAAKQLEMPR